ncbi:unnamed protein product [Heligmosomoides polygyrus]|uniref:Uncharacterized protein n=1 Tax=Heligmosomoides polygyrus TaxID=6339 RepID=A0A183G090_HELPZ|nr:unnamed protein product [Heligmosomoides polygyrus]
MVARHDSEREVEHREQGGRQMAPDVRQQKAIGRVEGVAGMHVVPNGTIGIRKTAAFCTSRFRNSNSGGDHGSAGNEGPIYNQNTHHGDALSPTDVATDVVGPSVATSVTSSMPASPTEV